MTGRCLYCYKVLDSGEVDFHPACSKKMFGTTTPPVLAYGEDELEALATEVIQTQSTVTGVQPKISLHLGEVSGVKRFTIVGLWGDYILKPSSTHYPQLPEVEDLTMHLASIARIKVVPHSLIRMQDGRLAYITKRIDRTKKGKLHMEDMCQLTERLTEDKYNGSYEQIGKIIRKYSSNPGLDLVNFFELVVFSFLTGNADMHLKNFSLLRQPNLGNVLSPAYDLVATALVNPDDQEELALTLNGKKRRIRRSDFIAAFNTLKLDERQQQNIFKKMEKVSTEWFVQIKQSFLDDSFKSSYCELIKSQLARLQP